MLRLFSSGHLAVIPIAVASGFIAGTTPVPLTQQAYTELELKSGKMGKNELRTETNVT